MRRQAWAAAALIGGRGGLTCDPGSAPNMIRRAYAPRTSPLNTNCLKESGIVMRTRLHTEIGVLPATAWLACTT